MPRPSRPRRNGRKRRNGALRVAEASRATSRVRIDSNHRPAVDVDVDPVELHVRRRLAARRRGRSLAIRTDDAGRAPRPALPRARLPDGHRTLRPGRVALLRAGADKEVARPGSRGPPEPSPSAWALTHRPRASRSSREHQEQKRQVQSNGTVGLQETLGLMHAIAQPSAGIANSVRK